VRIEAADVVVDGGRVVAVGPALGAGDGRIDCHGCLVIPGNVCGHTHLYSALARGMPYRLAPPQDFVEILRRVWWRLDRALDEASLRASALVGGMEALLAGTTTLVDHHASPNAIDGALDVVAGALATVGARACSRTRSRTATDPSAPRPASPRTAFAARSPVDRRCSPGRWSGRMHRSP
jgi:cytosine/adenosine deaminase-related metal-dependent hydrolase